MSPNAMLGAAPGAEPHVVADDDRSPDGGEFANRPSSWISALERTVNPAFTAPRLAPGVEFFRAPHGDGWIVRKLPEGRYLSLTDEERLILLDLDGRRTAVELARLYSQRHAKMGYFVVSALLDLAANASMFDSGPPDVVWAPLRHRVSMRSLAGRMTWINRTILYRKIPVSGLGPAIRMMYRFGGRAFFHPVGYVLVALVSVAGFVRWLGLDHPRPTDLTITQLLGVVLFASSSIVLHELGHALAVVHVGRYVNRAGIFIMYGTPGGFVDTGDMWLGTRRQRIMVTLAGPVATLLVGSVIALLSPDGNIVVAAMAMSQFMVLAANAMPLLKLDGYYVLMDVLQVPNLRERAQVFVTQRFKPLVTGAWSEGSLFPRLSRTDAILLVYGIAAFAWLFMISVAGIFLLPERMWRMGQAAFTIGTTHALGPVLGAVVVALMVLVALQIWGYRRRFGEVGRTVQSGFDRSGGWALTAIVLGVAIAVGGFLPLVIGTRSASSATGWRHVFALLAVGLGVARSGRLLLALRGSRWAAPIAALVAANALAFNAELLVLFGSTPGVIRSLHLVVLAATVIAVLLGGRLTLASLGADLRAGWVATLVGAVLCAAPVGAQSLGAVMLGAGTISMVRLLRRPVVSAPPINDVPIGEELTDRQIIRHLRTAVASIVERVIVQHGALYGATERRQMIHAVNGAAVEAGWAWWFVANGRFVDRNEGSLPELAELWGESIEQIVSIVGSECGHRVTEDAVVEAYLALPVRLGALVDDLLGESLRRCGCATSGTGAAADDPAMLARLTLAHLVTIPLGELSQAIGRDTVESTIGVVNAVATQQGWGRWFRANGQFVDEMPTGRDDIGTGRELLSLLYARLASVAGTPLTAATVQHARHDCVGVADDIGPVASRAVVPTAGTAAGSPTHPTPLAGAVVTDQIDPAATATPVAVRATALKVASWAELPDGVPAATSVSGVDLVIVRRGDDVSVLYGRCGHRGALLADGRVEVTVEGDNLVCGLHGWDYRLETGISAYDNSQSIHKFVSWRADDGVFVNGAEIDRFLRLHPQSFDGASYQGAFRASHPAPEEPFVEFIHELATNGLSKVGRHGPLAAMGVSRELLPSWDSIQFVTAQLGRLPLLDDEPVSTDVCIGPNADKPLWLTMPIFVSDMSFGALSPEAKTALARGAELAGTGICSGEGGMLPEEQAENTRYFYELASARFGWSFDHVAKVQSFHFKTGQGAKTGTGGHLPGDKVVGRIAEVRGLEPGTAAVSPARFPDWESTDDYRRFADEVRERSGGIPIGIKMSAQHIERDLDAAIRVGVDYVILDGRGGGTGAAPLLFRDNISVPTIPALARARAHLDRVGRTDITLIATGGIRTPADMAKALALGADAVALANSPIQAIGCVGMRACHTNNCPVGIATQQPHLRARLPVDEAAHRLERFLTSSVELMQALARACGHRRLSDLCRDDLTTFDRDIADLCGVAYGGLTR